MGLTSSAVLGGGGSESGSDFDGYEIEHEDEVVARGRGPAIGPATLSVRGALVASAVTAIPSEIVRTVCSLPGLRLLRLTNCILSSRDMSALCRGLPALRVLAAIGQVGGVSCRNGGGSWEVLVSSPPQWTSS